MGVAGLWDVLKPAAKTRSLTELAVKEGFQTNPKGLRGYRIGIDASIWFFHAEYGKEGENPVLRTLFFRCASLMRAPFLPLFVFDGPKRPDCKRGKRINKSTNKLITGMKNIVEAFGFEWRTAPGEAEAELAYLNRIGVIDGILSDDVDNFLFGALTVIRNQSNNLSGNKANPVVNSEGKDDKNHTRVFRLQDIQDHEDIQLSRGGLILIGLLSGGDYEEGLKKCGMVIAHSLARCGLGDTLFKAANELSREELVDFLHGWREELRLELKTNSKGFLKKRQATLSNSVPDTFPNIDVLLSYAQPTTSESLGHAGRNPTITWSKEPNFALLASACELYFEWGYKEAIIKRFRTVIWPGAVLRILRRAVLDVDQISASQYEDEDYGTPSKMIAKHFSSMHLDDDEHTSDENEAADLDKNLIVSISLERNHPSTDKLLEYRVEVAPAQLVRLAESGIKGLRQPEGPNEWTSDEDENADDEDEEGGRRKGKRAADPESHLRLWMPACMVDIVEKKLVKGFQDKKERKKQKKKATSRKKATRAPSQGDHFAESPTRSMKTSETRTTVLQDRTLNEFLPQTPSKRQPQRFPLMEARKEEEEESTEDEGELPVLPGISLAKHSAPITTRHSSSRSVNASRDKAGAATFSQRVPQSSYPSSQTIDDTLALNLDDEDELPALAISKRPVPITIEQPSSQSVSTSKMKQITKSSLQHASRSRSTTPFSRMVSTTPALTSEDEDELPVLHVKPSIPTTVKQSSSSRSISTSQIQQVAAISDENVPSSSLPSSKLIDNALALSDSEEELPADAYQTVQPKKVSKVNKIKGYVSLSDDEDHKKLPPPARHTQKNNKNPTQTTISSYLERDGRRKPSTSQGESSDNQQIQKSPRKSRKQTSPRHKVPDKGELSTIDISDEESDTGYAGVSQPNIAPLQLARARKAATPILRSTNVDDIIDLT